MFERICFILLANLLFFLKTIGYKYVSDDLAVLRDQKPCKNKFEKRIFQLQGKIRTNPIEDHTITIGIHALTCVALYVAFGATDISFLAAILFSFNPINNQGSVFISGRGYVLPALFILSAIAIPILGPIFMAAAAYYNIGFFFLPILVFSSHWWLALFIPIVWAFHYKRFSFHVKSKVNVEMFGEDKKVKPQKLILAIKTFGFYTAHTLLPIKNTFYHSFMQSMAGNDIMRKRAYGIDRFFIIGAASGVFILYYWLTHPWGLASFSLLWWCIGLGPFLNLFRMSQEIAERYAYLPSAGLMYFFSSVLIGHPAITAFILGIYMTKLWFYMDAYQDDYYLAELACMNSPDSWFAWHVRALKRWESQSIREAAILWVMAKMISPKEFKVLVNLATVLKVNKQDKEAEEHLKLAEENIPNGQEEAAAKILKDHREGKLMVLA